MEFQVLQRQHTRTSRRSRLEWHENGGCWGPVADVTLLIVAVAKKKKAADFCRQHVFAPERDRDLDISLGEEWQREHFLLLPNNPDWAKKGDLGQ